MDKETNIKAISMHSSFIGANKCGISNKALYVNNGTY